MSDKSKIITAILITVIIIYMAIALSGCSTPQKSLRKVYSEAWCDGFGSGYQARVKEERDEL